MQIELIFTNNLNQDLFFNKCVDANSLLKNQDKFAISLLIQNVENNQIFSPPLNYINYINDNNIDVKCLYVCKSKEEYKLRLNIYDSYRVQKLNNNINILILNIIMPYKKNGILKKANFKEVLGSFNSQNIFIR